MSVQLAAGSAGVIVAVCTALVMLRMWRLRWRPHLDQEGQRTVGCAGLLLTLCLMIVTAGALPSVRSGSTREWVLAALVVPVGAAWLFFGNVLMGAHLTRDE